jgi:hypothetical protein
MLSDEELEETSTLTEASVLLTYTTGGYSAFELLLPDSEVCVVMLLVELSVEVIYVSLETLGCVGVEVFEPEASGEIGRG